MRPIGRVRSTVRIELTTSRKRKDARYCSSPPVAYFWFFFEMIQLVIFRARRISRSAEARSRLPPFISQGCYFRRDVELPTLPKTELRSVAGSSGEISILGLGANTRKLFVPSSSESAIQARRKQLPILAGRGGKSPAASHTNRKVAFPPTYEINSIPPTPRFNAAFSTAARPRNAVFREKLRILRGEPYIAF